jgi:hypothetical protein
MSLISLIKILLVPVVGASLFFPTPLFSADELTKIALIDFTKEFDLHSAPKRDAIAHISKAGALHLTTGTSQPWPGIILRLPSDKWNLSEYEFISINIANLGINNGWFCARADNYSGIFVKTNFTSSCVEISPGVIDTIKIPLNKNTFSRKDIELIGMQKNPFETQNLDPSRVIKLAIYTFTPNPVKENIFEVSNIYAGGLHSSTNIPQSSKELFPLFDQFGQYTHKDWPGKITTIKELQDNAEEEKKDLKDHPGPQNHSRYGGWIDGPRLPATGHFRVEKHQGKWWLVDPDGYLFWSNGINVVRAGIPTPITDRQNYFSQLPAKSSSYGKFYYRRNRRASHRYYSKYSSFQTYNFMRANLLRKYGENWEQIYSDVTFKRLSSWGINTIANWSQPQLYKQRRIPYVVAIHNNSKRLKAPDHKWKKHIDVFDASFQSGLRNRLLSERGKSIGDPWCIGYFVDNEPYWGSELSLAQATLKSPPDQKAKTVFIEDLKGKYTTIAKLNNAWGTSYSSWDNLLRSTNLPIEDKAKEDLLAFSTKIIETYFRIIHEEIKNASPYQLYLGCRFLRVNDLVVLAATKYCDITSFNRYTYSVEKDRLPKGIDKPMIIGEFHFGALDRGLFLEGIRGASNQRHRAQLYGDYLRGALRNPYYVGAHWFQYMDNPASGRFDGENSNTGFVDGCDSPYKEIIEEARKVGNAMYEYRFHN